MLKQCDLKIKWSSLSLHKLLYKLLKLKYFESNLNYLLKLNSILESVYINIMDLLTHLLGNSS